ncbi:MAG: hypothetical protein NUV78_01475 [Candidatus Zambryskibacteria bacterium]|nr:hypothetical protein [Candidatus Zambryskibacteria bacterium]
MRISLSPKQIALLALGVVFLLYVLFQARFLILGPMVKIETPRDAEVVYDPLLTISGTASNIARITLNGRQIYIDENGLWTEILLLSPGTSIITVIVRDRFGREHTESVRVRLIQENPINPPQDDQEQENSTSTPSTSENES